MPIHRGRMSLDPRNQTHERSAMDSNAGAEDTKRSRNALRDPLVRALLSELSAKLAKLAKTGSGSRIDLGRLPLPAGGLSAVRGVLGKGQIEATFKGVGSCVFTETALAGVWWVQQYNTADDLVGEFIEIAYVPELLKCDRAEVDAASKDLELKIAEGGV